jgi:hypothetical protein
MPGTLKEELYRDFCLSEFIATSCMRKQSVLTDLMESGDIERSYAPGEYWEKARAALSSAENEPTWRHCSEDSETAKWFALRGGICRASGPA